MSSKPLKPKVDAQKDAVKSSKSLKPKDDKRKDSVKSSKSLEPKVDLQKEGEEEEEVFPEENAGKTSNSQWPLEVLYAPEAMTEFDGEGDGELQGEAPLQSQLKMDPESEEYRKYVQKVLEDQGTDFNESTMLTTADEGILQNPSVDQEQRGSLDSEELSDSEENESGSGSWSTSEGTKSSKETNESEEEFVQDQEPTKPLMGMKSFRYFESRVLASFLKETDDDRMNSIRERFNKVKKVKPPAAPSHKSSISFIKRPASMVPENGAEEDEDGTEEEDEGEGLMEFTDRQWAMKNAETFLKTAGCRSPEESTSNLNVNPDDQSPKLKVFLEPGGLGEVRRDGIGSKDGAPEITPALRRQAERAMWRAIIDNSKPKYPLPRFILPRHKFLKKVESELIGPGSYEHDYYEKQREKRNSTMPSMFRSCSSRFPKEKWIAPGANFIADPYEKWDAACLRYKHPGRGIPFESTPCNFRYRNFYVGCGIPPNIYDIKSPLEEFLNKHKFNKGQYDIASGADVFCPNKGKLADPASKLGPGAYDVRESIVKNLSDSYNRFKGKISQTERRKMFGFKAAFENPLWPKENGFPGPASYSPWEHEEWIEPSWAPFGVQANARKMDLNIQAKMLAADYYYYGDGSTIDKGWIPEIFGGGLTSNFVSTSPQTTPENKYNIFKERNQALNYHLNQDVINEPKKNTEC